MKQVWIYDLETLNIFTASFIARDSTEIKQFVISPAKDQRYELFDFLRTEVLGLIGFNCINFDAQVLEYMFRNPDCTVYDIRNYAQYITSSDNDRKLDVPEWKLSIPHLDLYRIHHFDNRNRRTSLKWCEYQMDLDNIEDMPSQGEGENWEKMVLNYNLNDCIATKELYKRTIPMIELRKTLTKIYGINLMNASNSKIGSEILLNLYCKKTGKRQSDVRSMRTYRKDIKIKDLIFPYIKFQSYEFNRLLKEFQNKIVNSTKGELEFSITYKGFQFDYGSGGIHGSINNKVIESDDKYLIVDADVSSLYPSIACVNKLYPKHLGPQFYKVYKHDIVDVRLGEKAKKDKGNKAIVDGFKESANSAYGKSNDKYSWMYDPYYTLQTTVNGQLMLTMLAENLMTIPDLHLIQINTDGLTVKIPRDKMIFYYEICQNWEVITGLQLEYAEYRKMIIIDVNNYIAIYQNGKTKCKGRCEFKDIPLYKNKSHNIIPIAFYEYFVNNKPVRETIYNHKNIFDFCAGVRAKKSEKSGQSWYELHSLDGDKILKEKLSKTVRYYISHKGKQLIKRFESGSEEFVEAPIKTKIKKKYWNVTYFNKAYYPADFKEYDIDYSYYVIKTNELISQFGMYEEIKQTQLQLI